MEKIVKTYLLDLQNRICQFIEQEDQQTLFIEDAWQHAGGGGGLTRVMENGPIIEKAAVNFSHVQGMSLPPAATIKRPELIDASFQALGVSVIVHPRNPYVPTTHLNVRFICVENNKGPIWWFGGGFDLTPYYGFKADCEHWHRTAKLACEPFGSELYPSFKRWADDYFFLKHRNEPRGIGGIFFDDYNTGTFTDSFAFLRSVGDHFIFAYQPILNNRKTHVYSEKERNFQLFRRGRYVEFNLLYDRGTLFGLQSGGRTESILVSLPPLVAWHYNWQGEGHAENNLYTEFLKPRDWI